MTGWQFLSDVLAGRYPAANWLLLIAGFLVCVFVVKRVLWTGFKEEFKKELNIATKTDIKIITDGLDEIKDILNNQSSKTDDTINRLSKREGIVQELSKRVKA
ncbi:MAG: hypothetical protein LBC72_05500 [Spirochaetaceae bacterium]|jgi:hypothetical protein|nr:hypothetical protein [Spirochaetaceae bacterium]